MTGGARFRRTLHRFPVNDDPPDEEERASLRRLMLRLLLPDRLEFARQIELDRLVRLRIELLIRHPARGVPAALRDHRVRRSAVLGDPVAACHRHVPPEMVEDAGNRKTEKQPRLDRTGYRAATVRER